MKLSTIWGMTLKKEAALLSALTLSISLSAAEAGTDSKDTVPEQQASKTAFWIKGNSKIDAGFSGGVDQEFRKLSWKFSFATEQDLLTKTPDVYWFQNSAGNFSGQVWEKIREDVKNGAAVFFTGYFQIPLDKYFQDPSFAVKRKPIGKIAFEQRKVSKVHPGKWLDTPCDAARQMRRCITPAYYYMPENPEAWTILAWMPESSENNNPGVPMLMVRPFGKGFVCVLGGYVARVFFSFPMLTENILANRDGLFQKSE